MPDTRTAPRQTWTLVLVSLGLFMTALDTLVVTTALPVLRVSLHTGLSDLEWTVNAYNLAFACSLLTGAALGDRFGRRRVFCVGIAAFTAASAGSALAPSVGVLIARARSDRALMLTPSRHWASHGASNVCLRLSMLRRSKPH